MKTSIMIVAVQVTKIYYGSSLHNRKVKLVRVQPGRLEIKLPITGIGQTELKASQMAEILTSQFQPIEV